MRVLLDTHVLLWARAAAAGWYEVARRGNHVQLRHPSRKGPVTMPHPRTDLPGRSRMPACRSMLLTEPAGRSVRGCGIVTRPLREGCLS